MIFGTIKDDSLSINVFSIEQNLMSQKPLPNSVNTFSKVVNHILPV